MIYQQVTNFIGQSMENNFKLKKTMNILEVLGSGSYGTVYKAQNPETKEISAIKVYKMRDRSEGINPTTLREICILKGLDHENIVKLKRVHAHKDEIELEMEYCDMDLWNFIRNYYYNENFYNLKKIKNIMFQILQGVNELHSNMIFHRDLKTSNILLKDNKVKIGDFGLSRCYSIPNKPYSREVMTLWYRPPELLLGFENYSTSVDMWSIGCIFGELLCKEPLFPCKNDVSMIAYLVSIFGNFTKNENLMPGVQYFDFFESIQNKLQLSDTFNRFKLFIMQKAKFKITDDIYDLLSKMLQVDPCKRISCKEALEHPFFKM